jgi:MFS family permease
MASDPMIGWQESGQQGGGRENFCCDGVIPGPTYNPAPMSEELPADLPPPTFRSHVTLLLCTILHAFTHAYGTLLVPLYLLMQSDLRLRGVSYASAVVTVYGIVYCALSFIAGEMADRYNRKMLLGIGLLGNALAITAMGLTRQYELIMTFGVLAGLFGTLFHPAANALVPAHYPRSPGMAIGLLGIGSGIGFFAGPQFAGWRAQGAEWNFGAVANWQKPLVEAGVAGVVIGVIFLLVAREVGWHGASNGATRRALDPNLRRRVRNLAFVLGCRDFAGIATLSLASIYLQKAHGLDAKRTGFIVGAMMLTSIVINPFMVYFSPGRRRLPMLATVLVLGGIVVALTPLVPLRYVLAVLMVFMVFQLGSYALSDAAMLERVAPQVRGRVVGLFLTIAGTASSTAPFVMGYWTDRLGDRAAQPHAYIPLFATLGLLMIIAAACPPLIARLGDVEGPAIEPITQTSPATMEPAL